MTTFFKGHYSACRPLPGDPNLNIAVQRVDVDIIGRLGDREYVPNYLVIITTSVGADAVDAINTLKRKGTRVIGVGKETMNSCLSSFLSCRLVACRWGSVQAHKSLSLIPVPSPSLTLTQKRNKYTLVWFGELG